MNNFFVNGRDHKKVDKQMTEYGFKFIWSIQLHFCSWCGGSFVFLNGSMKWNVWVKTITKEAFGKSGIKTIIKRNLPTFFYVKKHTFVNWKYHKKVDKGKGTISISFETKYLSWSLKIPLFIGRQFHSVQIWHLILILHVFWI